MDKRRIALVVAVAAGVCAYFAFEGHRYLSLEVLEVQRERLQALHAASPIRTAALYFAAYVAVTGLSVPGAAIMTLAAGAVFGVVSGTVLVSFASTIGATLAFLVARFLLRDWLHRRLGERLAAIDDGIARDGPFYLFALRLVPVFPFWLINLAMGLTSMRAATFYWVSQVGMLPGTVVYVYAGSQLGRLELSAGLVVAFTVLGLFPLVAKRVLDVMKARRVYAPWSAYRPRAFDYNVVVIGAGAAGLVSAYIAAATKAGVALVERHRMGGDCLYTGCVPSKALIRSARLLSHIARARSLGIAEAGATFDFAQVMQRVQRVVRTIEPHDSVERYTALGVDCVEGSARITSPWSVEVETPRGPRTLTTRSIVIAAGARPFVPPIPGLADVGYLTSDTVWDLRTRPSRLLVLGGGPIGTELAQAFARLGSQVTQVERLARLLIREDPEVSSLVQARLESEGVRVLIEHEAKRFVVDDGEKVLLAHHDGAGVRIPFDEALVAVGRVPNTQGYGLEALGIGIRENGTVETDGFLRTVYPNIFACGDVAGPYQFTHVAAHQAWYATINALFGSLRHFKADYRVIPWATFTEPEVARVGLNEQEAKARDIPHTVTVYQLDDLDRAIADEEAHGFVKVLTQPGTDRILGATIVGAHAGDLIAEYVLAMKHGLGMSKILGTIHVYPTMAEANRQAAGAWKRSTVTVGQVALLTAYHAWRRGRLGLGGVIARLRGLARDRRAAYPSGSD